MSPTRVLLVSWEYPPVMYGGLGRHVHALAEALARTGHEVVVLSQGPTTSLPDSGTTAGRPRVVRAPQQPGGPDVYADTGEFVRWLQEALVDAAAEHLAGWVPDVVHGHDWVVADATAALSNQSGAPMVATVHATEAGLWHGHLSSPFSRWRHHVERGLVTRARRTIVCSSAMRAEVVDMLGADPDRVAVVPNGVDASRWVTTPSQREAARAALGLANEPLVALVGRLEPEKGGQDAVDALSLMTPPAPHLALVGDGARRADLHAQAGRRGLSDQVHLVGRLGDGDVAALLAAADVALVPSLYEPFGLVALEAMAAGTAVVVSDTGGLAEIVEDSVSGVVVPPADPSALAVAIDGLLGDPERRSSISAAAQRRAIDCYGWARVAQRTEAVYDDALD